MQKYAKSAKDDYKQGEGTVPINAVRSASRRVAEFAEKDKMLFRLNPDLTLIRSSLRSLRL